MATTNVTIRMDEELKKQAEELFADLGLNMTTAFTTFVNAGCERAEDSFYHFKRSSESGNDKSHRRDPNA